LKIYEFKESKTGGNWIIEVVDIKTREKIVNAEFVVTDLDKKYIINSNTNTISLPKKPSYKNANKGKYEYGYTIITFSEGYLPRIDHNVHMGSDVNILIELEKPEPFSNASYTEFFHPSSRNELVDFLGYYFK